MRLSTGKVLTFQKEPNGATLIEQELTEAEWSEYCTLIRRSRQQEQYALDRVKEAVLLADAESVQWWSAAATRARLRMC